MSRNTAFILAAGFGTRLRPLTLHRPKPLLPLMGRPMIDYALKLLRDHGHKKIIVNSHHLWQQIAEWAVANEVELQVELPEILGTGGGLRAALPKLAQRVVVWNGDIIADIDLAQLVDNCPLDGASMALRHTVKLGGITRVTPNDKGVVERIGTLTFKEDAAPMPDADDGCHFTGIHAISSEAISLVPDTNGLSCIVRTAYCDLVPRGKVGAMIHPGQWVDAGTPADYLEANLQALRGELVLSIDPWIHAQNGFKGSWVSKAAKVQGEIRESVIGANARVPDGATLEECVVWDNATVPPGKHSRSIFHDGGTLVIGE